MKSGITFRVTVAVFALLVLLGMTPGLATAAEMKIKEVGSTRDLSLKNEVQHSIEPIYG